MNILQQEASLEEVVRLVGMAALSAQEQLVLHLARIIREDYLQQNAFDKVDTYTSLPKQYRMLKSIILLFELAKERLSTIEYEMSDFLALPVLSEIARAKFIPEDNLKTGFDAVDEQIAREVGALKGEPVKVTA